MNQHLALVQVYDPLACDILVFMILYALSTPNMAHGPWT